MPGAPNRPPETTPAAGVAPSTDDRGRKALRRLAPARVALRLDQWKGAPHTDLFAPFERAERAYDSGDFVGADSALDQLAVRFAEPRWPTLPVPFRELRATIVQPQPPNWDPESKLEPAERDARRARRAAETQLKLARASVEWARAHAVEVNDLEPNLAAAEAALAANGADPAFWEPIDATWTALRARVPAPTAPAARRAAPSEPAAESTSETDA
jgi:hypothetical protein